MMFQVDLVAQGDSVYDIIDASDHLIARNNLSLSTSVDTGEWAGGMCMHMNTPYICMLVFCVCIKSNYWL